MAASADVALREAKRDSAKSAWSYSSRLAAEPWTLQQPRFPLYRSSGRYPYWFSSVVPRRTLLLVVASLTMSDSAVAVSNPVAPKA